MLVLYLVILLVMFGIIDGIKNRTKSLSYKNTNTLKGFATIVIFLHHVISRYNVNQTIATMDFGGVSVGIFLILSGYGMNESLKKRENQKDNVKWILNKILKIFEVFFILFIPSTIIMKICGTINKLNISIIVKNILKLSYFGTANWYIKIQIVLYVFFGLIYLPKIFSNTRTKNILMFIVLSLLIFMLLKLNCAKYWFNTVYSFLIGIVLSENKEKIQLQNKKIIFCFFLISTILGYYLMKNVDKKLFSIVYVNSFSVLILLLDMKFPIYNTYMEKVSKVSLEFYLIHLVILNALKKVDVQMNIEVLITLFLSFLLSYLCYFIKNIKLFTNKLCKNKILEKYKATRKEQKI